MWGPNRVWGFETHGYKLEWYTLASRHGFSERELWHFASHAVGRSQHKFVNIGVALQDTYSCGSGE